MQTYLVAPGDKLFMVGFGELRVQRHHLQKKIKMGERDGRSFRSLAASRAKYSDGRAVGVVDYRRLLTLIGQSKFSWKPSLV